MRHTWRVTAQLGGDFVVDADNAKSRWAVAALVAGMTAVCIALVIWGGLVGLVGGLPGVVFFGAICLPYIVFRAVRPVSPLVVSTDGFTVHEYALDAGFIRWEEVQSIETSPVGAISSVVVRLRDPVAFVRRHRPVRRALLRLNSRLRRGYVRISGVRMPLPVSEVAAIMEAKRSGLPDAG
jgi:hypothetical protein